MFRNILAAALRNLVHNRLYAAINIAGLTLGFSAALLIALFIRDEYRFERWMPGFARTYAVSEQFDGPSITLADEISMYRMADWLKSDISSVESVARLSKLPMAQPPMAGIRHSDVEGDERLYWADPNIFSVLPLPAIAGDLTTALERPDGIVLTRRIARKYFGRDDPVGDVIELGRQHLMTVTAVLADLPSNTHLSFDFLASGKASFSDLAKLDQEAWPPRLGSFPPQVFTYLRLKPGADIARVRSAMPALFERHGLTALTDYAAQKGFNISYYLKPIADIHLSKGTLSWLMKPRGNTATIYALGMVAFVLVLVAGVNFVSLMTARAVRRAVEVGIRKVSGAMRRQLALQFIGESVAYVAISLLLAALLVTVVLPAFNAFLQRDSIGFDPWCVMALVGAAILIGALASGPDHAVLQSGDGFKRRPNKKRRLRRDTPRHGRRSVFPARRLAVRFTGSLPPGQICPERRHATGLIADAVGADQLPDAV